MKAWVAPLCALVTGIATLAILVGFSQLPEVEAAYPNGDFATALSAFQRATSIDQLTALFGNPPDGGKLAAMTAGNTLDLYGFIPVYTIFLLWGAILLGQGRALMWFPIVAVLIGCAGDIYETSSQLAISTDWSKAASTQPHVAIGCWIKFFGLAVHGLGCSALCFTIERKRWILGVLGLTPIVGTAVEFFHLAEIPTLMTATFSLFWVGLIVVAAIELFRTTRTVQAASAAA